MTLLANNQLPYLMFAAGAVLAILILLKRSYRYFGRRSRGGHITKVARPDTMPSLARARCSRWSATDHEETVGLQRCRLSERLSSANVHPLSITPRNCR